MADTVDGLPYSPDEFVDREDEIELVLEKARNLAKGVFERNRTVIFLGPRGAGKSWLMRELAERLRGIPKLALLFLDLRDHSGPDADTVARGILQWVSQQVAALRDTQPTGAGADAGIGQLGLWLMADVRPLLEEQLLALLVDHVDESPPDLLGLLEDHLLAPLAKEPRVLVVLAGRNRDPRTGKGYTWKAPELKQYNEERELQPFKIDDEREQIRLQKSEALPLADDIYDLSRGFPLSNYLLADQVRGEPPSLDRPKALRHCADVLLALVPDDLWPYFEALCVLNAFDEARMPSLLAAYFDGATSTQWDDANCARLRRRLVYTGLARWDEPQGGYVIDAALRTVLENGLRERDLELWSRLHCAAWRLYMDWAETYPRARDRWQSETDYHAECLREAGYDPEECAQSPGQE